MQSTLCLNYNFVDSLLKHLYDDILLCRLYVYKLGPVHLTILRFIMSSLLCISTNKINHFTMCSSLQLILVQWKSSKHSVLSFMYCIVLSMKLFSIEEWLWCSMFRNLHACGYQVPPSVEILCFPYLLISDFINCSATSIPLSLYRERRMPRIILFIGSIATHNHT